jgi:tetratricopeptide (TPR) repeat protein
MTIRSVTTLAILLAFSQQVANALPSEQVLLQNLQKAEKEYGANDQRTGELAFALGRVYHCQHQTDRQDVMFNRAMKIFQKSQGTNGDLLRYYSDELARVYLDEGRKEQSETLFKTALAIGQKLPGKDKTYCVPNTLGGLAQLYESQGKYAEAEAALQDRINMRKRFMNAGQVDLALVDLASLYTSWGKYDKASPLFDELLKISPMPTQVKVCYTTFLNKTAAAKQSGGAITSINKPTDNAPKPSGSVSQ